MVDGVFDRIEVEDLDQDTSWTFEEIDFQQDGFSFTCFVDSECYPLFDTGYRLRGIIDGVTVADGSIISITPVMHDGDSSLRIVSTPPTDQSPIMTSFE